MDLDEVVSGRVLFRDEARRMLWPRNGPAIQGRPGGNEPRTEHGAVEQLLPERQMRRTTQHAAHRRHAIRNEQAEIAIQFRGYRIRHVGMHFRQPGHQESIRAIDNGCVLRNRDFIDRPDRHDAAILYEHRLCLDDRVIRHWQYIDVDESDRRSSYWRNQE